MNPGAPSLIWVVPLCMFQRIQFAFTSCAAAVVSPARTLPSMTNRTESKSSARLPVARRTTTQWGASCSERVGRSALRAAEPLFELTPRSARLPPACDCR
jgi:hypothetical protein